MSTTVPIDFSEIVKGLKVQVMNNTTPNPEGTPDPTPQSDAPGSAEVNIDKGLQVGLDAIQKVFAGLVTAVKNAIGPEMLRMLEAGNFLSQVGTCLDETAAALRESGTCPPEKLGELACLRERLAVELKGSKFEGQTTALRERLEMAGQAATAGDARSLAVVAGYFHAAAKTAAPAPATQNNGQNYTIKFTS